MNSGTQSTFTKHNVVSDAAVNSEAKYLWSVKMIQSEM